MAAVCLNPIHLNTTICINPNGCTTIPSPNVGKTRAGTPNASSRSNEKHNRSMTKLTGMSHNLTFYVKLTPQTSKIEYWCTAVLFVKNK